MKKTGIIVAIIISLILAFFVGYLIANNKQQDYAKQQNVLTDISEVIEDDCTDEYEYEQSLTSLKTNSEEEKISPNAIITFKRIYNGCNHEVVEQKSVNTDLVNKTKSVLQDNYNDWNIEEFSSTNIIMSKRFDGNCNEEFILRDKEGVIVIYKINEKNEEVEYSITNIATDYLAEPDKVNIKNGLKVVGKQELNKIIEDFE